MAELKKDTSVDISKDAALLKALSQNSKVIYDVEKGTFAYKVLGCAERHSFILQLCH